MLRNAIWKLMFIGLLAPVFASADNDKAHLVTHSSKDKVDDPNNKKSSTDDSQRIRIDQQIVNKLDYSDDNIDDITFSIKQQIGIVFSGSEEVGSPEIGVHEFHGNSAIFGYFGVGAYKLIGEDQVGTVGPYIEIRKVNLQDGRFRYGMWPIILGIDSSITQKLDEDILSSFGVKFGREFSSILCDGVSHSGGRFHGLLNMSMIRKFDACEVGLELGVGIKSSGSWLISPSDTNHTLILPTRVHQIAKNAINAELSGIMNKIYSARDAGSASALYSQTLRTYSESHRKNVSLKEVAAFCQRARAKENGSAVPEYYDPSALIILSEDQVTQYVINNTIEQFLISNKDQILSSANAARNEGQVSSSIQQNAIRKKIDSLMPMAYYGADANARIYGSITPTVSLALRITMPMAL